VSCIAVSSSTGSDSTVSSSIGSSSTGSGSSDIGESLSVQSLFTSKCAEPEVRLATQEVRVCLHPGLADVSRFRTKKDAAFLGFSDRRLCNQIECCTGLGKGRTGG